MKKLILIAALAFAPMLAKAQIAPNAVHADPQAYNIGVVGGGDFITTGSQLIYTVRNNSDSTLTGVIPANTVAVWISMPIQYGIPEQTVLSLPGWSVIYQKLGSESMIILENVVDILPQSSMDIVVPIEVYGGGFTNAENTILNVSNYIPGANTQHVTNTDANNDNFVKALYSSTPLSIQSCNLFAQESGCAVVKLNWTLESSSPIHHWEMQFSNDGSNFAKVNAVSSNQVNIQTAEMLVSQKERSGYYRMKLHTVDGAYAYSNAVKVVMNCITGEEWQSVPNPASDHVRVTGSEVGDVVQIINAQGAVLNTKVLAGREAPMDVSKLSPGAYLIQLKRDGGILTTKKFIKL